MTQVKLHGYCLKCLDVTEQGRPTLKVDDPERNKLFTKCLRCQRPRFWKFIHE